MSTSEKILQIINDAHPNPNLLSRASQNYDVQAQLQRERQFYDLLQNPITGEPIKSIQDLNNLIHQLDTNANYGFEALLPGGAVERELSNKYNLNLNARNKFSELEQQRIKQKLNDLGNRALKRLFEDPTLYAERAEEEVIRSIIYVMGGLNINEGDFTIFTKDKRLDRINFKEYALAGLDSLPKKLNVINLSANLTGSKTQNIKKREGTRITYDSNGVPISIDINPDLNTLSEAVFNSLYEWAEQQGDILEERSSSSKNPYGSGTISPMSVTPAEFEKDVFTAVSNLLGGTYKGILLQKNGQFHQLYTQYDIYNQIALGRQLANVRGFLGELRAILILDAIAPNNSASLMGTAKVKLASALSGGESAPVDLLVDLMNELGAKYGFQVKNTSELSKYSWGNMRSKKHGMSIPNFYMERLQDQLTQSEQDLFGAFVYNQPVPDYDKDDFYANNIYSKFEPKFDEFYQVYKKLALYIIRQTTKIESASEGNEILIGDLVNDFFIMNDKIVPASAFYQAMNENNENLIDSTFNIDTNSTGYYDPEEPIPSNYSHYSSQAEIFYNITVKYSALLQSAYNLI